MERLLDCYEKRGDNIDEFKAEIQAMANATKVIKCNTDEIELLSQAPSSATALSIYRLKPGAVWNVSSKGVHMLNMSNLPRKKFEDKGCSDLVSEYENTTGLLFYKDTSIYFTSANLPITLSQRTGVAGEAMMTPSLERDILVATRMGESKPMSLITRSENGIHKVFAALSEKYKYVPQTFLNDALDAIIEDGTLGETKCYNWLVNQKIGEIYLEFPEKADEIKAIYELEDDIVPGLYLAKSDVGECSVTVRSTWRIGSSVLVQGEIRRKHIGKFEVEKLIEDVKTTVFDKYTILPDRLCDLMQEDITDPTWKSKMSAKRFESKNKDAILNTFKHVFKQIDLVKATAKTHEMAILEQLMSEIDPSESYTAYDLCMMIMTIPSRITGLPEVYATPLAMACGKAPYVSYKMTKKGTKSGVVLTA